MSVYSIDCADKDVVIGYEEYRHTFVIRCDDEDDNNSFNFESYGDDEIVIDRNRCNLDVYIKENKTPNDKYFTIYCTHSNDRSIYVQITILQQAREFKLEITDGAESVGENKYEKEMKSVIEQRFNGTRANLNYNYYEEYTFGINVVGGSEKYRIESILRCQEDETDGQINYRTFDNGFIYNKFNDKIIIRNYGKPFVENDYYLMKLCHEDSRDVTLELKLTYSSVPQRRRTTSTQRHIRRKQTQPQISNIYMPYEEFMENLKREQETTLENSKVECEIRFIDEIGEEFVVIGKRLDIVLPFEVFEDGEISDLMVRAYASGNWASVTTDETNRNLKIGIRNMPIMERKSYVNVSVVDYPDAYVSFILTNKPQES